MVKNSILAILILGLTAACTPPSRFIVTTIGYEPEEVKETILYALPETNISVGIEFEKEVFLPGPYCDYTLKLLGIEGANRLRTERYSITTVSLDKKQEADPEHFYSLNLVEGVFDADRFSEIMQNGYVLTKNLYDELEIVLKYEEVHERGVIPFKDVTMEPNVEMKRETIYKTILMDTSFIRVPVVSEQLEKKTLEKKAEEASKLILEIRNDRYFLAAGMVDPYPQDFDLATALKELDKLEEEYLSLFIGKSYSVKYYREFFLSPQGEPKGERFILGSFSVENGFVTTENSGENIQLAIVPLGKTNSIRNLMPQLPEEGIYNKIYYRIPEITDVSISVGEKIIHQERISMFQFGAMVNESISQ